MLDRDADTLARSRRNWQRLADMISGNVFGGSMATDPLWDAKGDIAAGTGANTAARLPVGTNGKRLIADSTQTTGLNWQAPILTTKGDTLAFTTSEVRLPVGADGQHIVADSTAAEGYKWVGGGTIIYAAAGSSSSIANTTTDTAFSTGTVSIPSASFKVGRVIRVKAYGYYNTTGTPNMRIACTFGTGTVTSGPVAYLTGAVFRPWRFETDFTIQTLGAAATMVSGGWTAHDDGTTDPRLVRHDTNTVDTTSAQNLVMKAQWSVASPSNNIVMEVLTVELLNS